MAPSLIGEEGEQLVLFDRSAGGYSPHVLPRQVRRVVNGVGRGVEGRIATQIVCGAMQLVGAGFHLHGQHAACAVSELGVHAVLLDVDLLHGVHRRRVAVLLRRHRRRAVEDNVILVVGVATHVELRSRPMVERALLGGGASHCGGVERHQQVRIAVQDRQRVRHLRIHGQ